MDPLHLPLVSEPMDSASPQAGIHPVFEDSLPDAWGRAILCRRHNSVSTMSLRGAKRRGNLIEITSPTSYMDV